MLRVSLGTERKSNMPKDDFTNREITTMFEHIKEQLKDIKDQTTMTNGRVTKLEHEQAGLLAKVGTIATVGAAVIGTVAQKVLANF